MFYERLSLLCRLHGTNITEVAVTELHVTSAAPSAWKKGATPRADVVTHAAQHFGVSADYLLGLTDTPLLIFHTADTAAEASRAALARLCSASHTAREAAIAAMEAVIDAIDK